VHRSGREAVTLIFTLNPRAWTAEDRAEWELLHSRLIDPEFYVAWHEGQRVRWVKEIECLGVNRWCVRVQWKYALRFA
jgi:hypothetical protein